MHRADRWLTTLYGDGGVPVQAVQPFQEADTLLARPLALVLVRCRLGETLVVTASQAGLAPGTGHNSSVCVGFAEL